MRTTIFLLMLLLTLTACAAKDEMTPEEAAQVEMAEAEGGAAAEDATADAEADKGDMAPEAPEATLSDDFQLDPVGEVKMVDGTAHSIAKLEQLGKYFIYITGKLNGRSSTVISLTRMSDVRRWAGIAFEDPSSFTIVTGTEKQLKFSDARVFLGVGDHYKYTFWTIPEGSYQAELITVDKKDVKAIAFRPVKDD